MSSEKPADVQAVIRPDQFHMSVDAGALFGSLSTFVDDDTVGLQVHQDGTDVGLGLGSTYKSERRLDEKGYTYASMGAAEARELAAELEAAADLAEQASERLHLHQSDSLFERVVGRFQA